MTNEGADAPVELRDPALLKLYFAGVGTRDDVVALARVQEAKHTRRLAEYERIQSVLAGGEGAAFAMATLRLGLAYQRLAVGFWRDLAEHPPTCRSWVSCRARDTWRLD